MRGQDDPTINDEDALWRRIPPFWVVFDQNLQRHRPASAAFEDDDDSKPMSVFVEKTLRELGGDEGTVLASHDHFSLVSFTAGLVRELDQVVFFEKAEIPGHAVVEGCKTRSIRKRIAKEAVWVKLDPPPGSS